MSPALVPIPDDVQLLLMRHGSTAWNEAGRLCGWRDVPLSDRGRSEADGLRGRAEELLADAPRAVWSSDLLRARETARLAGLPAAPDPRLRELNFGALEGARWEELSYPVRAALIRFEGFRAPGGESVADLAGRVGEFVAGLSPGVHIVVAHGGVIRLLLRDRAQEQIAPGQAIWRGRERTRPVPGRVRPRGRTLDLGRP